MRGNTLPETGCNQDMARPIFTQEDSLLDICDDFAVFRVLDARRSAGGSGATGENPGDKEGDIGDIDFVVAICISLFLAGRAGAAGENARDQKSHIGNVRGSVEISITGSPATIRYDR